MSRRLGGVEQRLTDPHVLYVVHAQTWVLEQVADLVIDLEWPVIGSNRSTATPTSYYN
jgi:hypothetical protein